MPRVVQFKILLNRELSQFAESSKAGTQISEYICSTFLGLLSQFLECHCRDKYSVFRKLYHLFLQYFWLLLTSDILVLKLISVLVFILFSSQNFYFI